MSSDHEATKGTSAAKSGGRDGGGISLARIVAWLAVVAVAVWLLSLTLRTSSELSLGRVRISDPVHELNLEPFTNKLQPLRNLFQSPYPGVRRSAWTYLFVDVLGNFAVFVPFGVPLATALFLTRSAARRGTVWQPWLGVTLAGLLLSLFIEIAQLAIPSRVTDVDDVILNTLGTAAGALLIAGLFRLRTVVHAR